MTQLITLTPKAVEKAKEFYTKEHKRVFFGVHKGGCSGWMYDIHMETDPKEGDELVEQDGAACIVSKDAKEFLKGSTIDYTEGLQDTGFKIKNPNITKMCGCGHSVG